MCCAPLRLLIPTGFQRFTHSESSTLYAIGSAVLVQALLLPALLKVMPEKWILVASLVASALEMVGFVIAPSLGAWAVYLSMVVGAPSSMSFPVISAVKSVHAGADEQGKVQVRSITTLSCCNAHSCSAHARRAAARRCSVASPVHHRQAEHRVMGWRNAPCAWALTVWCGLQGALFAARAAAQGSGPLLFSALFNIFTQAGPHYFPGAPILGLAIIMAIGAVVACSLKIPPVPAASAAMPHIAISEDEELSSEECVELLRCSADGEGHRAVPVPSVGVSDQDGLSTHK